MQLVEQHCIKQGDSRYQAIDEAAVASKNLYNAALYEIRQAFIKRGYRIYYPELYHLMKFHEAYRALPAKVAQHVLKLLDKNWTAFQEARKAYEDDPSQFQGKPKMPGYKDKQKGRNILIYTRQALAGGQGKGTRKGALQQGLIKPSGLPIEVQTKQKEVDQVRIVPRDNHYVVEIVYEQAEKQYVYPDWIAGIDIGLDNLATLTSNKSCFVPRIVNGRPVKSINQYYNKERARLQACLPEKQYTSRRLDRLTAKRTRRINHYLHEASKHILDLLVSEQIGTLVIGKNPEWKQDANMGKRNTQNFVSVPHARFIDMLTYKARLVGIKVVLTEESYTSKCSFLDHEPIKKHEHYMGKRIARGMFCSQFGKLINADVNGSYNIIKKVASKSFEDVEGVVVHPRSLPCSGLKRKV